MLRSNIEKFLVKLFSCDAVSVETLLEIFYHVTFHLNISQWRSINDALHSCRDVTKNSQLFSAVEKFAALQTAHAQV